MYIHGLGTQVTERLSMSHIVDVIDMLISTFEAMPSHVTIDFGIVNWDRVITKTTLGMLVLVGAHLNNVIIT